LPLHAGVGKVLAAALPNGELTRMLDELGEVRRAGGVVVSRAAFLDELRRIREQGYSISRNEREYGTASVAAPVMESTGLVVAAVSVAGPTNRLERGMKSLVVEVCGAARAISERVGRT
jgi:DNA-binding IclR family transcriptional regulator